MNVTGGAPLLLVVGARGGDRVRRAQRIQGGGFSRDRRWAPVLQGGAAGRGEDQVAGAGGYRVGRLAALRATAG